jgi:hypothetical protein
MIKIEPCVVSRVFIPCPDCGATDTFQVDHLFEGVRRSFGPWPCEHCGIYIKGEVDENNNVSIETTDKPRQRQGLMLLKIAYPGYDEPGKEQIYFVFDQPLYSHMFSNDGTLKLEGQDYYINEHTCPTNITRNLAIIFGNDVDPHGVFRHVQTVIKPDDFSDNADCCMQYADWCEIFDKLEGVIIEGSTSPTIVIEGNQRRLPSGRQN